MDIKFTSFSASSAWVQGTAGNYTFYAKLFDEPSCYGINEGRVSKLEIRRASGKVSKCILNYDRGWDVLPETTESNKVFREVLDFLEAAPKRFDD